ncbi:head GIN domain-containing protein [Rufibacter roseus]|uniref:Auto-transporter adhesin head GIN domain-containing protein n=1 Tax=Rufibacter roseus TaxID=1567108 RepID=A0ABW2DKJ7_9BACT|nr:hypothetical protein [Rufibacter roseus]
MKKSNILLFTALAFFVCCLTAFNFAMKAQFDTGQYKDRYFDYVTFNQKGFSAVEVNGAARLNVRLTQGPHQVRAHKDAQEYLEIRQEGNKLIIDVNHKSDREQYHGEVLVSLPELTLLEVSSKYTKAGKPANTIAARFKYGNVQVTGFSQDSLQLLQDHATSVLLTNLKLDKLTAVAGTTPGSTPELFLAGNTIQAAHFDIKNKGKLELNNMLIPNLSYEFSDSASANFTGTSLQLLKK